MKCTFYRNNAIACAIATALLFVSGCKTTQVPVIFDSQSDVGDVLHKGSAVLDEATGQYRITGSGANMWAESDAFHFVWKKVSGDLCIETNVDWQGAGANEHRKAGCLVRQSLNADSPYADAVLHGDGLISLQYRSTPAGPTQEIKSPLKGPATMRLERHGHLFSLSVAPRGADFVPTGSVTVELQDPVYVGLAVCSHDADVSETAVFSDLKMQTLGPVAPDDRIIESTLETIDVRTNQRAIVYRAKEHFEAPNWSADGKYLIFNSQGKIYRISTAGARKQLIDTGLADHCNNDHGLSPDGKMLAISHHNEGPSLIYVLPAQGGEPRLITPKGPSYWHGWSPDAKTLVYCAERNGQFDVYAIALDASKEIQLTTAEGLDDGPEYSPDGRYIYFNSERTGVMKIWRMNPDGHNQEQVTFGEDYADWFAHPSPDGKWLVFLSYDKSVTGHPANKNVSLRMMPAAGGQPEVIAQFYGGQGTINVPSWSPDSTRVAFVSYRLVGP